MVANTAADMFLDIKHHIGINNVLLCCKHKWLDVYCPIIKVQRSICYKIHAFKFEKFLCTSLT